MTTKAVTGKFKAVSQWMKALQSISIVLIGLFAQGTMAQTTTVLNFDSIADSTMVTNQYQAQGVLAQGVVVSDALFLGIPAVSGANVAYAPTGLMQFSLSISDVKTISTYITGPTNVGIYGYDANNTLVASSILSSSGTNVLLSATSSGAAITKVEIHNGGASFAIDDLKFITAPSMPICQAATKDAYDLVTALPLSAYIKSKTASKDRTRILSEIAYFEKLRASGRATQKTLLTALSVIQNDVKCSIRSPQNAPILQKLNDISILIKNNAC